jgi:hypothetical protein
MIEPSIFSVESNARPYLTGLGHLDSSGGSEGRPREFGMEFRDSEFNAKFNWGKSGPNGE